MTGREMVFTDDSIISAPYCTTRSSSSACQRQVRPVCGVLCSGVHFRWRSDQFVSGGGVRGMEDREGGRTLTTRELALLCSYARSAVFTSGRLDMRDSVFHSSPSLSLSRSLSPSPSPHPRSPPHPFAPSANSLVVDFPTQQ